MNPGQSELWRIRAAGAMHEGRTLTLATLRSAIEEEMVGDLDEVKGPRDSSWRPIGEHPQIMAFLPQPTRLKVRVEEDTDSDLTPMIDVTFQLLIFFMITATFAVQKTLELPRPEAAETSGAVTMEELEENNVMVRVAADGGIMVDDQPASIADLPESVRRAVQKSKSAELVLDVHDDAVHDVVVKVLDAAGAANIEKVHFVSRAGAGNP